VFLARVAAHELEGQKDRLAAYQVQARFALASMYDRAANADTTQKGAAGGNQAAPATPPPEEAPAPPEEAPAPPEQAPVPPEQAPVPKATEPPR
jgi:hypothetical protein